MNPERLTFAAFAETYVEGHTAAPATLRALRERLRPALAAFGDEPLSGLERKPHEFAAFRTSLGDPWAFEVMRAVRQVLDAAVSWQLITRNPAKAIANPAPARREVVPFSDDELARLVVSIGPVDGPLVTFAAETGLRPAEWVALEWRDVDHDARVVRVERSYANGTLKPFSKNRRASPWRRVPLTTAALDALDQVPRRLDSRLIFAASEGGYVELHNWRRRAWRPALDDARIAAGRRPYDLRHTYATRAIAACIPLYKIARYMGTSVRMIDQTYGHLEHGSELEDAARLDAHAERRQSFGRGMGVTVDDA